MANENNNAAKQQVENTQNIHENYSATLKVTQVTLFDDDEEKINLQVKVDKQIQGIVKKDGKFTDGLTNVISFPRGTITRELTGVSEDVAMIRSMQREAFTQREFALLLIGSTITVDRTWHENGEEVDDGKGGTKKLERGQWFTAITSYKPSKRASKALDSALEF